MRWHPLFMLAASAWLSVAGRSQTLLPFEVRTANDVGVVAIDSANRQFDVAPSGTSVPASGLALSGGIPDPYWAALGLGQLFSVHYARTNITPQRNPNGDPGLRWVQNGNSGASGTGFIGSSSDGMTQGPQQLRFAVTVPAGTTGEIFVQWSAFASRAATTSLALDVDGDGVADATLGAGNQLVRLPVTAGPTGISITATQSVAMTNGIPGSYGTDCRLAFRPSRPGPACVVTNQPTGPCGLGLTGQIGIDPFGADAVQLQLTGSSSGSFVILVAGPPLATPIPVPGAACPWLVDDALVDFTIAFGPTVDWSVPTGAVAGMNFDVQVVGWSQSGVTLSNVVSVTCP